jgi:hypothetical protein
MPFGGFARVRSCDTVTWLHSVGLRDQVNLGYVTMPLTGAEKQARYRARNVVLLSADAPAIADRLLEMEDQAKLIQIVAILKGRLDLTDGRCRWVWHDGGRKGSGIAKAAGRKNEVGDCVARAIAIATGMPYREVHDALTVAKVRHIYEGGDNDAWDRRLKRRGGVRTFDPDHGCRDSVYGPYLKSLGWRYTQTKNVRLRADELPRGRLIVSIRRHLVAVIDHVIHDTHDCGRTGRVRVAGYWTAPPKR